MAAIKARAIEILVAEISVEASKRICCSGIPRHKACRSSSSESDAALRDAAVDDDRGGGHIAGFARG